MYKRNILVAVIIVIVVMSAAACGRGNRREESNLPAQAEISAISTHSQTLSVSAPSFYGTILREAEELLQQELALQGIGFNLEFDLYQWDDIEERILHEQARFAAGMGYDLIMLTDSHPVRALIDGGFLADLNPLIDSYLGRENLFCNVLDTMAVNGSLYTFPINFGLRFVGINANLPQEIIARFAQYNSITMLELAQLYNDLRETYPEFEHLSTGLGANPRVFASAVQDFMDGTINWRFSTLTPPAARHFNSFLNVLYSALHDNDRHGVWWNTANFPNPRGSEFLRMEQERYAFSVSTGGLNIINALFDFYSPYFVHHIPMAGENSGLKINATSYMFGLNSESDGELALAFLYNLAAAHAQNLLGVLSIAPPIRRDLFHAHAEASIRTAINQPTVQPFSGQGNMAQEDQKTAAAVSRLYEYTSLPFSQPVTMFLTPQHIYNDTLSLFLAGMRTAVEARTEIQDTLSSWLEEEESIIVDTQWVNLQIERANLPVRTISILAESSYTNVLRQAEYAMNRAWAESGAEYNFNLNITAYDFSHDLEEVTTRLQVMLMAGLGYDIFLYHAHPLWTWADSGLLTDIWTLIDNDPATDRSDFYLNILEAFEHNGGLWGFPVSFGFEYVGISTALPEFVIQRFMTHSTNKHLRNVGNICGHDGRIRA